MKKVIVLAVVFVMALFSAASAELKTSFYGYQWLRAEYKQVGALQDSTSDLSQLWIPRTYLRWKVADDEKGYSGNITLDVNMAKGGQEVTTTSTNTGATDADGTGSTITSTHTHTYNSASGKVDWAAWVKYGYVELNKIPFLKDIEAKLVVGLQKMYFGTIDTWEYPLVEKAMSDKHKVVPGSADLGVALTGYIPGGFGDYQLAVYNGKGYKNLEANEEKLYVASLNVVPLAGLYARLSYATQVTSAFNASPTISEKSTGIVIGGATGPIEAWFEYNTKATTKAATFVGYAAYACAKVIPGVSLDFLYQETDADIGKPNDTAQVFSLGTNLELAGKGTVLTLNYQHDRNKHPTKDSEKTNIWYAQFKWSY